jgi:hypothetical protein
MKGITVPAPLTGIVFDQDLGVHAPIEVNGVFAPTQEFGFDAVQLNNGDEGGYSIYWVFDDGEWILFDDGEQIDVG